MEIGVGLDARLGLTFDQHRQMAGEAARLGYTSLWSPAAAAGLDSFHVCAQWHGASALATGISVVPSPAWTLSTLASEAATLGVLTGGKFTLGIGPGGIYDERARAQLGLPAVGAIGIMREHLRVLRGLLAGERVDSDGPSARYKGVSLGFKPPRVPVILAALGPQMLRLAGELSDGASPNWSTPEQNAWAREQIDAGARKAGRDPSEIPITMYIRVCVDDDEDAARRAFAEQVLSYAMARPGASKGLGYRAHFARMGFAAVLDEVEARRDAGARMADLVDMVDPALLRTVGYFGKAAGAAAHFKQLARGLDTAVVRVVAARPGIEAVAKTLEAFRPELVRAA